MTTRIPTLLVVDDEPFNQEIISEFLASCDYDLIMANNGLEAMEKLTENPERFDAVLLDRMMPGMDGIEVLKKIKQDARLQMLPVIMQTASSSPDQIADGLEHGAFYYLTKPFGQKILQTVITTAIRDHIERLQQDDEQTLKFIALQFLQQAEYHFKTRADAQAIAGLLSHLCPLKDAAYMGLVELMLNAIEHGNLNISYDQKTQLLNENRLQEEVEHRLQLPEYQDRFASVSFLRAENVLMFTIRDQGAGFNWEDYLEMSMERLTHNHGRGIAMSRSIAFSGLAYQGSGNTVIASIQLKQ